MACAGEFVPSYGDSGDLFHGLLGWASDVFGPGYLLSGDPVYARALQNPAVKQEHDLFREPIRDQELTDVAERVSEPPGTTSQLLPGVGFASLQTGNEANRTALAVFYGIYWGHAHCDRLQLDLYAHRNALTPDLGYPETADAYDPRCAGFISHTVTHNTVMVNASRQAMARGRLHIYDPGNSVQLVETSAEACYPGAVKLYRRTLMLVDAGPDRAYVVDIFRVRGGTQHDWMVHGTHAEFETDLHLSAPRTEGTLAGADVPYGYFYDDKRYDNDNAAHIPYHHYEGSAFQWLTNVQEAYLDGNATASWRLNRPPELYPDRPREGVVLRAHMVGQGETVWVCNGAPQRKETWPDTLKFLFRRRVGGDLESVYVTVFEPYKGKPFIKSVRPIATKAAEDLPAALEVDCGDRTHVIFSRLDTPKGKGSTLSLDAGVVLDARGAVLVRDASDGIRPVYVLDGKVAQGSTPVAETAAAARSRVKHADYGSGQVTLTGSALRGGSPAGSVAIVESGRHADAVAVSKVIDRRTFFVGDEDLSAGTVHVTSARGERIEFLPKHVWFIQPGMTAVNEDGKVVGRIESVEQGSVRIRGRRLTLRDFPDRDGDGQRTMRAMVVGPGDRVTVHHSIRKVRAEKH